MSTLASGISGNGSSSFREHRLAILFGAPDYPKAPGLNVGDALANSYVAFKNYLVEILKVPSENILDLFGNPGNDSAQLALLRKHLEQALSKTAQQDQIDIFVYYVGHGMVDFETQEFAFSIASTESRFPVRTSLKVQDLARDLRNLAKFSRRYVILDCCFAGEAGKYFLADSGIIEKKVQDAFSQPSEIIQLDTPTKGCALLCATDKNGGTAAVAGEKYTRFTSALLTALKCGDASGQGLLTLGEVSDLAWRALMRFPESKHPFLISPEQPEGDLAARVRVFPNAANTSEIRDGLAKQELVDRLAKQELADRLAKQEKIDENAKRLAEERRLKEETPIEEVKSEAPKRNSASPAVMVVGILIGAVALIFGYRSFSPNPNDNPEHHWNSPRAMVVAIGPVKETFSCYSPEPGLEFVPNSVKVHIVDNDGADIASPNLTSLEVNSPTSACLRLTARPAHGFGHKAVLSAYLEAMTRKVP